MKTHRRTGICKLVVDFDEQVGLCIASLQSWRGSVSTLVRTTVMRMFARDGSQA